MKEKRPSVDPASFDLAEHFLSDIPGSTSSDRWDLAAAIQQTVEEFCIDVENRVAAEKDDQK